MQSIRPAGSGNEAECGIFVRSSVSPFAAVVFVIDDDMQLADWPKTTESRIAECQLGHAAGWGCEVRVNDVVVVDPLGEGLLKAALPELTEAWQHQVRSTNSAAVFLVPRSSVTGLTETGADTSQWARDALAAQLTPIMGATVRTSINHDVGAPPKLGRNEPCHCGSGKKFKTCHGR
jgi:hypothetical protein